MGIGQEAQGALHMGEWQEAQGAPGGTIAGGEGTDHGGRRLSAEHPPWRGRACAQGPWE